MKWNKSEQRGFIGYSASIKNCSVSRLCEVLGEFWAILFSCVIPLHRPDEWNEIRISFWFDAGRIIAYPAMRSQVERNERSACDIWLGCIEQEWMGLDESESDRDFTQRVRILEKRIAMSLLHALNTRAAKEPQLCAACEKRRIPLRFYSGEGKRAFLNATISTSANGVPHAKDTRRKR